MKVLFENEEYKLADELKKEFKVSEKRYYHVKLMTLAEQQRWTEVEKLAKAKKSPIGYEVILMMTIIKCYDNTDDCLSVCYRSVVEDTT